MKMPPRPAASRLALALAAALAGVGPAAQAADPGYYLVSTYENPGVVSLDYRYWTVKFKGEPVTTWPEVGVGYGINKRWYTEVYASFIGGTGVATRLSTLNWQNDYLLTQGQYPFDLAIHSNLIANRDHRDGTELELGPVLRTDFGRTQLNANLLFERAFGADQPSPTKLKYQWQLKYRWKPLLHVGVQGFGELGEWDHWAPHSRQSHRAGPVLWGSWYLGGQQAFSYQAAYLMGSIYGSHGSMFSLRLLYDF
jgi:hypothetical protein